MFDLGAIFSLLKIPAVFFIVMLKTVVGIPAGVFHSMFAMVNMERFQLDPTSNGQLLSYVGILTLVGTRKMGVGGNSGWCVWGGGDSGWYKEGGGAGSPVEGREEMRKRSLISGIFTGYARIWCRLLFKKVF